MTSYLFTYIELKYPLHNTCCNIDGVLSNRLDILKLE